MKTGTANAVADRMRWLQNRTRVLSDNIANSDTPRFQPRDLAPQVDMTKLGPVATHAAHIAAGTAGADNATRNAQKLDTRPSGNSVNLEDEMLKLSDTQLEYQMLTTLYQRGISTMKTAIGKRG